MSKKALDPVNLLTSATAPTVPTLGAGDSYYDTALGVVKVYDGANWQPVAGLYTSTATSGTTIVLTANSNTELYLTGSTAQTVTLPVTSTLILGDYWDIYNDSTAATTVNSSGANLVLSLPAKTGARFTAILLTGTTAASWSAAFVRFSTVTGTGANVLATSPTLVTPVLGTPSSGTLTSCTGLPIAGTTGWGTGVATALAAAVSGSGSIVLGTSPTITTPKVVKTYTAKTAAYTFVSGDEGNIFSMNAATSVAFTVPVDATFNFGIGTEFHMFWVTGAGQPTISAVTPGTTTVISTGATSATPKLRAVNSMASIVKIAANSWVVTGDIA